MEATVYTLSALATLVTAAVAVIGLHRSHEGRQLEHVFVETDRSA